MTTKTAAFVPILSTRGDAPAYSATEYGQQITQGDRSIKRYMEQLTYEQWTLDFTLHPNWVEGGTLNYVGEFGNLAREMYPDHDFIICITPWSEQDTPRPSGDPQKYRPAGANSGINFAMTMVDGGGPIELTKGIHGVPREAYRWWLYHEFAHILFKLSHAGYLVCRQGPSRTLVPWCPSEEASEYSLITPGSQPGGITMGQGRHLNTLQATHAGIDVGVVDAGPSAISTYPLQVVSSQVGPRCLRTPLDVHPTLGPRWVYWEKRAPRQGLDLELASHWDNGYTAYISDIIPGHTQDVPNKLSSIMLDMAPKEMLTGAEFTSLDASARAQAIVDRIAPWYGQIDSNLTVGSSWTHPVLGYTVTADPGGWLTVRDMPHVPTHHDPIVVDPPPDDPCQEHLDTIAELRSVIEADGLRIAELEDLFEAAQNSIERILGERDAALARIAELEGTVAAAETARDEYRVERDAALARIAELEARPQVDAAAVRRNCDFTLADISSIRDECDAMQENLELIRNLPGIREEGE